MRPVVPGTSEERCVVILIGIWKLMFVLLDVGGV